MNSKIIIILLSTDVITTQDNKIGEKRKQGKFLAVGSNEGEKFQKMETLTVIQPQTVGAAAAQDTEINTNVRNSNFELWALN
jgi:hypothetical protein